MTEEEKTHKLTLLGQAFSPTTPIVAKDLFIGRMEQLNKVVEAIIETGQHIVLFGERGVGKTSLANIIDSCISNIISTKVVCNRADSFNNLWQKALRRIRFTSSRTGAGFNAEIQLDAFLPQEKPVEPSDLLFVLEKVTLPILFIFDEFDSIKDASTKGLFADAIKALSDSAPRITILLVGVADSVIELVGQHQSIERSIKQIRLQRMSDEELGQIVDKGMAILGLTTDTSVRDNIIQFSNGLPHYTHLISKFSAKASIAEGSSNITKKHFDISVIECIDNAQESIREAYQIAVMSTRIDNIFEDVLAACAITVTDEHGTFRASDLEKALEKITGKSIPLNSYIYHLGKLCQEDRKHVIQKITSGKISRYKFKNPLLKAYVLLKLYQSSLDGRQLSIFDKHQMS